MKTIIPSLFCLVTLFVGACSSDKSKTSDNKIVIGTIDSIHSNILNEQRKIWVYVPNSDGFYAKQNFPVVYLLDGDAHFYSVMGLMQQLSEVNGNLVLPQMILVGIPNTDRIRDLTPSHDSTSPERDSLFNSSGGGEIFTSFIEKELIPYVDSLYPTAPYRVFIGHSFGGLLVVNTLINHTNLFNAYVAIDASIWWDNKKLLKQAKTVLAKQDFEGTSFFLAISNLGKPDLDFSEIMKDTAESNLFREQIDLISYSNATKQNKLTFDWRFYKDDDHGSVPLIAEYDALRFIFNFYKPKITYNQIMNPTYNVDSSINAYSNYLSKLMGYHVSPPESFINSLGYTFLGAKQYDKAVNCFKLNIENYPTSANVYDSMGELLLNKGDTIGAIENYEKSLIIYPKNENAKNIIKKIKEKSKIKE